MRSHGLDAIAAALLSSGAGPHCSGFNLPWWGEVLMFLLFNPWGWACVALWAIALVVGIVAGVRRWLGRGSR